MTSFSNFKSQLVSAATSAAGIELGGGGGGATEYASLANLPSAGNTSGNFAFVTDTKSLYVWDGVEWDRVYTGPDEQLYFVDTPADTYAVSGATGNPFTIDASAIDPEGFPVSYDYITNPSSIVQGTITNNQDGTFTLTPSTDVNNGGLFDIKFKATDGLNILTKTSRINVYHDPEIIVGPYQSHTGTAFGTNPLGGTSDPAAVFATTTPAHWHTTNTGTRSWGYDFGENSQYMLAKYRLMQRYSTIYHAMTDWTVEGSNDNTNWTYMSNESFSAWGTPPSGEVSAYPDYWKEFTIPEANRAVYRYIRLVYTGGTGYQVIGSVELYGYDYS